ncbi:SpoIIE family protein phosphatase [Streptomyces collinus]|uniref:SpoIIE family protein phosphatase n=1 Tax=Streptomyces collinus TaxID=42684 RepID=UPI0033EDFB66
MSTAFIDQGRGTITYGSAGPPPVFLQRDGAVGLLDRATDHPLGDRPQYASRIQAAATVRKGAAFALYPDGLV